MSLYAVVADGADEVVRLAGGIPYHDAAAGTHVVFSRNALRAVLHVVARGVSGEHLVDALVVGRPVFGMDPVFPDIPRAVHVLGRQAVGVHRALRPAGEVVFHVAEVHVSALRNHFERLEQGVQHDPPVLGDDPDISPFLERMALLEQLLLLQPGLVVVHLAVGAVEHVLDGMIGDRPVFRQPGGHDGPLADADVLLHLLSQGGEQARPVFKILAPEHHDKFVPADAEHGAVVVYPADQHAGSLDIIVARLVALRIVDHLQAVDIAHHDAEGIAALLDLPLQLVLHLMIGRLVFRMRQFVPPGYLVGHGERRQLLLLPADVLVAVFDADDEMAAIGGIRHRHARILRLPGVDDHAVILGQLPPVLQLRDQVVPVQEEPDPLPVLGVNQPARVPPGRREEIIALLLDLQFAGFLLRGQFRVMRGRAVDIVDHVIMIHQPLGDLRIGHVLLLVFLQGELCPYFRVDILDADDDVLAVPGHDFRMPDVLDLAAHDQAPRH